MGVFEWFRAKIEVRGQKLKVFVGEKPNSTARSSVGQKHILLPAASCLKVCLGPLILQIYRLNPFLNKEIQRMKSRKPNATTEYQKLKDWSISKQYPRNTEHTFPTVLDKAKDSDSWKVIKESEHDHINLSKYFSFPNGIVVARKEISYESTQNTRLFFDFVGKLQILLNGNIVFNYENYRFERLKDDTFSIFVEMKKGPNELIFISEGDASIFGEGFNSVGRLQHQNWGFMAKIEPQK